MKHFKATIVSVLVLPGAGHILLGQRYRGALVIAVVVLSLSLIMVHAYSVAQQIADQIIAGDIPFDLVSITKTVSIRIHEGNTLLSKSATYGLVLTWILASLDTFRVERKRIHSEESMRSQ